MHRFIVLFCLLASWGFTWASEFGVAPVRIYMKTRERSVALTVFNNSDEELLVQSELFTWRQSPAGEEQMEQTDEVALSPPIARIPANSRQVFRLVRIGPPPVDEERTYRIILREVPEATRSANAKKGVQLAMAFSLPIFMLPNSGKTVLICSAGSAKADSLRVICENKGNIHTLIHTLTVTDSTGAKQARLEPAGYVLPGAKRTFELKASSTLRLQGGKIDAELDDGTVQSYEFVSAH